MFESLFRLQEHNTNVKTEVRAGVATFLTMAYIIAVNPAILSFRGIPGLEGNGIPFAGVVFATVLVAAVSSILMGLIANLPFALAPGMGINAFVAFSMIAAGVQWQTALGAVFISGIIFLLLSLFKVREMIVEAIPASLRFAVAAGIGLFLALIGLKNAGFVVANEATLVSFGGLNVTTGLFIIGLILTGVLVIYRIKGALIIGILVSSLLAVGASLLGWVDGIVFFPESIVDTPDLSAFLKLDIAGALSIGMILPIFTLLFTDMFDSISTFVGVAEVGGFIDKETQQPKNVGKALLADAIGTTLSGLFGTSSATTYIESAAGVEEGGRTGLTAVVTGLLFLPFIFLAPLVGLIPSVATAPILVLVGLFMIKPVLSIDWTDFETSLPAFLAMILVPLTYSITQGIVWGFLSYTLIKVLRGKIRQIPLMLWIVDLFAVLALIAPMLAEAS